MQKINLSYIGREIAPDGKFYCKRKRSKHDIVKKEKRIRNKRWASDREIRLMLSKIRESKGCNVCGEKDYRCLVFHHQDRKNKSGTVFNMMAKSKELGFLEINKCIILCCNCHAKLHNTFSY